MDLDKHAIGSRIKQIRSSVGLSTTDFGKKADNADRSLVTKWERGDNLPNDKRLKLIANIGGITVEELLHGSIHQFNYHVLSDFWEKEEIPEKVRRKGKENVFRMFMDDWNKGSVFKDTGFEYKYSLMYEVIRTFIKDLEHYDTTTLEGVLNRLVNDIFDASIDLVDYFLDEVDEKNMRAGMKPKENMDVQNYVRLIEVYLEATEKIEELAAQNNIELDPERPKIQELYEEEKQIYLDNDNH